MAQEPMAQETDQSSHRDLKTGERELVMEMLWNVDNVHEVMEFFPHWEFFLILPVNFARLYPDRFYHSTTCVIPKPWIGPDVAE